MRKILITMCMFVLSLGAYSQKIIGDELLDDGSRLITTSNKYTGGFSDRIPLSYYMAITLQNDKQTWYLGLEVQTMFPATIKKDAKFLIKTRKEEVITLLSMAEAKDLIGKYNSDVRASVYRSYPMFKITQEQLEQIMQDGVLKVRLELDNAENGYVDKEYKKEKVVPILKTEKALLDDHLAKHPTKGGIEDGF